jgi:hypothetical protein
MTRQCQAWRRHVRVRRDPVERDALGEHLEAQGLSPRIQDGLNRDRVRVQSSLDPRGRVRGVRDTVMRLFGLGEWSRLMVAESLPLSPQSPAQSVAGLV